MKAKEESFVVQKLSFTKDSKVPLLDPIFPYELTMMLVARRNLKESFGIEFYEYEEYDSDIEGAQLLLISDFPIMSFSDVLMMRVETLFNKYTLAKCAMIDNASMTSRRKLNPTKEVNSLLKKIEDLKEKNLEIHSQIDGLLAHLQIADVHLKYNNRIMKTGKRGSSGSLENWFIRELSLLKKSTDSDEPFFDQKTLIQIMIALGIWLPVGENLSLEDIVREIEPAVHKVLKRTDMEKLKQLRRFVFPEGWEEFDRTRTLFTQKN